ncbi:6163_t:CDS:2, partial [Scutellospora calospora]
ATQISSVEEDKINKPFRPIPSGLTTVKGAKCRLMTISIIFPIVSYLLGGTLSLIYAFIFQIWVILYEKFNLHSNAFFKNFFTTFAAWTEFSCCYYIIIVITLQVQDFRDQKGDKFVGRKTLPILIGDKFCRLLTVVTSAISLLVIFYISYGPLAFKKNLKVNAIDGFILHEFVIVEFILIVLNICYCIRLILYRQPKQDNITYQRWYSRCSGVLEPPIQSLRYVKQIGKVLLPTETANFLTIKRIDRSIDELNKPSTPTGQSYHRESNSSPHKVQIPVLSGCSIKPIKIPSSAFSDLSD